MKIKDFNKDQGLKNLIDRMGATLISINKEHNWNGITDAKLEELIKIGEVEIDLEEVDIVDGIFDYKGKKVIVYIRDQSERYHTENGNQYKFHLTKCKTIQEFIHKKRAKRYVISKRVDGTFTINLIDYSGNVVRKGLVEKMNVCKNCLEKLNYESYNLSYTRKNQIYSNFNLEAFFDRYENRELIQTNLFRKESVSPINTYNENFKSISESYRKSVRYRCENCRINLESKKNWLHTHHLDGDKSNNHSSNLNALCIECHSKIPHHGHMQFHPDYRNFIEWKGSELPF